MTDRAIASIIAASLLLAGASRAATPPAPVAASSPWLMDYDGDRCVLSRKFGTVPDHVFVQFIRYAPGDAFVFNVIGQRFATGSSQVDFGVRFGDRGDFVRTDAMTGTLRNLPGVFTNGRLDNAKSSDDEELALPPVTPAMDAAVTSVSLRLRGRQWTLTLGPMNKPMAALRACEAELVRQWGLDPVEQAALASPPHPLTPPYRWLVSDDYPQAKLSAGEQAIIAFRLMVGVDGTPTGCSVQANIARDKTFAELTCKALMRRARFTPARSAAGVATASYYTNQVRWVIP